VHRRHLTHDRFGPTPLTAADIPAAGALLAEAYPHRAHEPERWDRRPNDAQRWVITASDGSLAAYVALWRVQAMQFRMDLVVRPRERGRGMGTALLDFLIARARAADATSLQARPYAEEVRALGLLASRGFHETMRMIGLELDDVPSVSLEPAGWYEGKLAERGLRVTTFAEELRVDADGWRKLRDTNEAARFGWPDPDPQPDGTPGEEQSVEQFRAQAYDFHMIPEACFVALDRERYVGYSALALRDAAQMQAGSGGTAVRPEYRGLGVATALKARCVRWAQENGVRRLSTSSGNPAMVHVNEKFGFRRTYVEVRLVRRPV
jgi:GNAT superfamily N-acetyltransferase